MQIGLKIISMLCYCSLQLAELYKQGRRLPRGNCSMNVMQIILNCWSYAPTARPSFDELATKLRELLHSLQRQERETAPQRLQQDNCYMPMERTMSSITNGTVIFNITAVILLPVAS